MIDDHLYDYDYVEDAEYYEYMQANDAACYEDEESIPDLFELNEREVTTLLDFQIWIEDSIESLTEEYGDSDCEMTRHLVGGLIGRIKVHANETGFSALAREIPDEEHGFAVDLLL